MEKETYIETILNSTNGITKVAPKADLFSKIEFKIQSKNTVSTQTIWLVAASIVVLLTINVCILLKNNSKSDGKIEASFGASINKSNQLY